MMRGLVFLILGCVSALSWAHKASDSYLTIDVNSTEANVMQMVAQWDIALRDLEHVLGLDADGDGKITWGETKHAQADIAALALANLQISTPVGLCVTHSKEQLINDHSDGRYAVLMIDIECPTKFNQTTHTELTLDYQLMFDVDRQHRGLVQVNFGDDRQIGVFSPDQTTLTFALNQQTVWDKFVSFFYEGVWHIWMGYDHILFLLSLLLPVVLIWKPPVWVATMRFTDGLIDVLKIVTAFTLAHSVTLCLAALNIVVLPVRWVEAAIALSVVIAAINNVKPFFQQQRWVVALGFGLIHGFGFANVLADLGLGGSQFVIGLIGFNVGVEIGQLALVGVFLPLAYWLRHSWCYRRMVFHYGSMAIIALAAVWFVERSLNVSLLSVLS